MGILSTIKNIFTRNTNEQYVFSIRETVDLTGLPIITLRSKGNKVNMLVDTGSTSTIIDKRYFDMFDTRNEKKSDEYLSTLSGYSDMYECDLFMHYDGYLFDVKACVVDCSEKFDNIASKLHGILGSDFLEKYKYIIDYEDYKVYKNK